MTGLDLAFRRGFAGGSYAAASPYVEPYQTKWWQDTLHVLGKPEEWMSKALAFAITNDAKERWDRPSSYWNQSNFAEVLHSTGVDKPTGGSPWLSTTLGLGMGLLLDPVNYVTGGATGALTRAGVAGRALQSARKGETALADYQKLGAAAKGVENLKRIEEGGKAVWVIDTAKNHEVLQHLTGQIFDDALDEGTRKAAHSQFNKVYRQTQQTEEINKILSDYQKAGKSLEDIELATSKWEQARRGQRVLFGMQNPLRANLARLLQGKVSELDAAAVVGTLPAISEKVLQFGSQLGGGVAEAAGKAVGWAANAFSGGTMPIIRGELQKGLESKILQAAGKEKASLQSVLDTVQSLQPELFQLSPMERRSIVDALENPIKKVMGNEAGEATARMLDKILQGTPEGSFDYKLGKRVVNATNEYNLSSVGRLTPDEKVLYYGAGKLGPIEKASAQANWAGAGNKKDLSSFEIMLTPDAVAIKHKTPVETQQRLKYVRDIEGVAQFEPLTAPNGETFLAASKGPGMSPASEALQQKGLKWTPIHSQNLEVTLSALAGRGMAVTNLTLDDILMNAHGRVQIINLEKIYPAKNIKSAREVSTTGLNAFLDGVGYPQGTFREFPHLASDKSAKIALKEQNSLYTTRLAASQNGVGTMLAQDVLAVAANMESHREYIRSAFQQTDTPPAQKLPSATGYRGMGGPMTPDDYAKSNNIDRIRKQIQEARSKGEEVTLKPVEIVRHEDGYIYVRDGRDRLTAAVMEDLANVPIKEVGHSGEKIDFGAYLIRNPKSIHEAVATSNDFATTGLAAKFSSSSGDAVLTSNPEMLKGLAEQFKRTKYDEKMLEQFKQELVEGRVTEPPGITYDLATHKIVDSRNNWKIKAIVENGITDAPLSVRFVKNGAPVTSLSKTEMDEAVALATRTQSSVAEAINGQYKIVSESGKKLTVGMEQVDTPAGRFMLNKMMELFGNSNLKGYSTQRGINLLREAMQSGGSEVATMVKLAERISATRSLNDFATTMEDWLGHKLKPLLANPSGLHVQRLYNETKSLADQYLSELARNGVFTNKTIHDVNYLRQFGQAKGVVESYADNIATYVSPTKTVDELGQHVKSSISQYVDPNSVRPFDPVRLVGIDGDKTVELRHILGPNNNYWDKIVPLPNRMNISKEALAELEKQRIYYNPTKQDLRGLLDTTTGRLLNSSSSGLYGHTQVNRPTVPFFFTPTKQMFIGAGNQSFVDLVYGVYKEGPPYVAQFGLATREAIYLNNPFGTSLSQVGTAEVRIMERKLREIAKKFDELGFSSSTKLDITSGFDPAVWKQLYGDHVTIGDVLKDSWKLDVPEELRKMPLDIHMDAPHAVVNIERPKFADPRLQKLFTFIQDTQDALFLSEAKKGLPVNYYAPYFHRAVTQEGREAMAKLHEKFQQVLVDNQIKHTESFLKQRLFHDYTTNDINDIINSIRRDKTAKLDPDTIYSKIFDKLRNEKDYKTFDAIADEMNKVDPSAKVDFFHTDPLYSLSLRALESNKATTRQAIVKSMQESGAVAWTGTNAELSAIRNSAKTFETFDTKIDDLTRKIQSASDQLETVKGFPDIDKQTGESQKLMAEIDKLKEQRGKQIADRAEFSKTMAKNHGLLSNEINLRGTSAYMDATEAQRLIESGLIQDTDINFISGGSLVEVPLTKYADLLDKNNAKIMLFTEEAKPVALKYFGSTDKLTGFPKQIRDMWDFLTDTWRRWTLLPIPSYHVRNAFSNLYMSWLGGLSDPTVFNTASHLMATLKDYRNGGRSLDDMLKMMDETQFISDVGGQTNLRTLYQEFINQGGSHEAGLHFNEFSRFTKGVEQNSDFIAKAVKAGLQPSSQITTNTLLDNKLLKYGRSLGVYVDTYFRFAVFLDAWKRMGSFRDAGLHMKSVLYDYSNLSVFERSVLRRVFPFYAWSRQNIPRMLETMATDPMKHYRYGKWVLSWERAQLEGRVIDQDSQLPDWMRHGMLMDKDDKGNWYLKTVDGFIPTYEVLQMFHDPVDFVNDRITPFLKFPVEQLMNYSNFTKNKIEDYPGQPARGYTLSALGFSRRATAGGPLGIANLVLNESAFNTAFRLGKVGTKFLDNLIGKESSESENLPVIPAVIDLFIGRMIKIDPKKANQIIYTDWQRTQTRFKNLAEKAERDGKTEEASQLRKLLFDLEVRKSNR